MERVAATRSGLLAARGQIALAAQGRDLLIEKRAALVDELRRQSTDVLAAMGEIGRAAADALRALTIAEALDGPDAVRSAALAAEAEVELAVRARSVAGVQVVEVERSQARRAVDARGYSLAGSTPRIDDAAERHEEVVELLLDLVAVELSLRRLASEIESTTRRVNALDQVVLPRLERERGRIAQVLEERELEDRGRLRLARAATTRRGVAS